MDNEENENKESENNKIPNNIYSLFSTGLDKKELTDVAVRQLSMLKERYLQLIEESKVSIRKDVVASELKDILVSNSDGFQLRAALEEYIESLYKVNKEDSNGG